MTKRKLLRHVQETFGPLRGNVGRTRKNDVGLVACLLLTMPAVVSRRRLPLAFRAAYRVPARACVRSGCPLRSSTRMDRRPTSDLEPMGTWSTTREESVGFPFMSIDAQSWSVLVVEDHPGVRQSLRLCLEMDGARVLGVGSVEAALEALERASFDLVLLDIWLGSESSLDAIAGIIGRQPAVSIIVTTALATIDGAVDAVRRGAFDYLPKPFTPDQVRLAARRALEAGRLKRRLAEAQVRLPETTGDSEFFESASPLFRRFLGRAARVSSTEVPVLLRGESGTGKNVIARWLWRHSSRARGPFVSVSCPSLSTELMNSTLFGHKKGAFTGAIGDADGKVQEAQGGFLFLDEVGDLSLDAQARLLRFLNDRSYERVGEAKERHADVRIVTATNRSLEDDLRAGRFREDLFHRLNVVSLALPALRDRKEDLTALARHYLSSARTRQDRTDISLSDAAERAIRAYEWPGNLRELRNAIERALILSLGPAIEREDLGIPAAPEDSSRSEPAEVVLGANVSLDDIEREHIARVIARASTLDSAARTLGIDSTTLQRKRKRYHLV
jgi:NtrC-family two-component system response regulator AlgB